MPSPKLEFRVPRDVFARLNTLSDGKPHLAARDLLLRSLAEGESEGRLERIEELCEAALLQLAELRALVEGSDPAARLGEVQAWLDENRADGASGGGA